MKEKVMIFFNTKKTLMILVAFIALLSTQKTNAMQPTLELNETTKTCLLTGATSGIGREIARQMIARGWTVIGIARHAEKLQERVQEFGPKFVTFVCDVSDQAQIHETSEAIKHQGLKPTLFFLNAGIGGKDVPFQSLAVKHKQMFQTNYFGVINWIDEWVNELKTYGGGAFIATSSVAAFFARPGGSGGYSASKAAVNQCFQGLRMMPEYSQSNIRFVTILCGPVKGTEIQSAGLSVPFAREKANTAELEAELIVQKVLEGKEDQIETSPFFSNFFKGLSLLPADSVSKVFQPK